jgi:hypothetical protein
VKFDVPTPSQILKGQNILAKNWIFNKNTLKQILRKNVRDWGSLKAPEIGIEAQYLKFQGVGT